MSAEWICDGCGKREPATPRGVAGWSKPHDWFSRVDADGVQDACSRQCIERISKKTGKTGTVLPI